MPRYRSFFSLFLAFSAAFPLAPMDAVATWQQVSASGPPAVDAHGLVYDSQRNVTVLFGGYDGQNRSDETWEFDGTTWTLASPAGGAIPDERNAFAMVYDSIRGVTVLFGGFDSRFFDDTWEWDGIAWSLKNTGGASGRSVHAMAFDASRGVTVLYGGNSGASGTWEWNGSLWQEVTPTGGVDPGFRRSHAMTYDPINQRVLLFGGEINSSGDVGDDLWAWDGLTWTEITSPNAPPAREEHAIAFDTVLNRVLIFGGQFNRGQDKLADTWSFDGTDWTEIATTGPSAREDAMMAFDTARSRAVLYGGQTDTGRSDETWEFVLPVTPTPTVAPTNTPVATATPAPTGTPAPTATPTMPSNALCVELSGSYDTSSDDLIVTYRYYNLDSQSADVVVYSLFEVLGQFFWVPSYDSIDATGANASPLLGATTLAPGDDSGERNLFNLTFTPDILNNLPPDLLVRWYAGMIDLSNTSDFTCPLATFEATIPGTLGTR